MKGRIMFGNLCRLWYRHLARLREKAEGMWRWKEYAKDVRRRLKEVDNDASGSIDERVRRMSEAELRWTRRWMGIQLVMMLITLCLVIYTALFKGCNDGKSEGEKPCQEHCNEPDTAVNKSQPVQCDFGNEQSIQFHSAVFFYNMSVFMRAANVKQPQEMVWRPYLFRESDIC